MRGALALVLAFPLSHVPTFPRLSAQETSLTIYADGRVLVRRTLPISVSRGASTISVDLGVRDLDGSSLLSLDTGVRVSGVHISTASGLDGSLRRSLGTDLLFRVGSDTAPRYVRGRVLSVNPPAVRIDGGVMYGWPGTPVFPDSMVQLLPRFELTLDAARPANALHLLFMSSGLGWHATYAVMLPRGGEGRADISGNAQMSNNGIVSITGAQVQLVAGDVRAAPRPAFMAGRAQVSAMVAQGDAQYGMIEEGVGGVHIYSLPGTVDFAPGESQVVALFPATSAGVTMELALQNSGYGYNSQWPDTQRDLHPSISYRIHRPASSDFGRIVVPGGTMRVFEPDSAGRPQLLGEVVIPHTPAGRDILATTGTSFDVTAQRTQTDYKPVAQRQSESAYRVDFQNASARAMTVLVTDVCNGHCEVLESSVPAEQGPATMVGFKVTVPANGSAMLTYRVRARW
ncbi:MAG TPA: hypothetical protein VGI92_00270 [Gemmatimonadales bacterium]